MVMLNKRMFFVQRKLRFLPLQKERSQNIVCQLIYAFTKEFHVIVVLTLFIFIVCTEIDVKTAVVYSPHLR